MRCFFCHILFYFFSLNLFAQAIPQKTFQSVLPSQSGVTFSNTVRETPDLNIITYEYFYNGGGVALGDFNNDGLIDIYLTANLLPNKLYLNKGNWQFEDITAKAGVGGKPGWKTGVSIADVNGDGLLDIYVCYSGPVERENRTNQLFMNNGDLTFTDRAGKMGVADSGYTTQAAFFDYDHDGDLDLFVLNHNNKNLRNFDAAFVKKMVDADAGDRLYKNDNNVFTDVTLQAGIISNPIGYGLGVSVSDINGDGWPDLYVSNDYVEEDYLYINNHDGTFSEKLKDEFGHLSNFSMGNDIADINNDGLPDVFTVDMLPVDNKRQKLLYMPDNYEVYKNTLQNGFYHQLMRNMLQLNNGDGTFSEIGQVSNAYCSDWSWASLFADFNNDGNKDLFVTNGYGRDMTNRDFVKFYANERLKYLRGEKGDNMFRMLQGITVTPLHNYMFVNNGNLGFTDSSSKWGLDQMGLSQGAAYADLDNDGDLDLVVNHLNAPVGLYRNMLVESGNPGNYVAVNLKMPGKNSFGIGAKVTVHNSAGQVMQENYPVRGFQSSMQEPLHIGLASDKIDSIVIAWPDGNIQSIAKPFKPNSTIDVRYISTGRKFSQASKINPTFRKTGISFPFKHTEPETNDFKVQPLMPNMISYNGPRMAKGDINKDGLEDIYVCGAKGQAGKILLQQSSGNFVESPQKAFEADAFSEDADAVFFDADNDGDLDLYVVSGGYAFDKDDEALQDRLYINDNGVFIKSKTALPLETSSGSCVRVADIDNDGDLDLFVGGRVVPERYPEAPESFILVNDGKGIFKNATLEIAPFLQHIGMVTDAAWIDINKDGKKDLLVCGEWMSIHLLENDNGKFSEASSKYFKNSLNGWWNRLCLADMDGDGDLDLVAGNWGTNSAIHVNKNEPATLYFNDFDNNGSVDPLICYYIQGKEYPMASRDEITDQMVGLRQKFPTYDSYSEATIKDILTPDQMKSANKLYADHFETTYFENKDGVFIEKSLPVQANFAPVYAIICDDYNHDGKPDILLAGNIEQARIKIGKIDANYGVLLTGDGRGNFAYQPQLQSGLSVKGCVRDIIQLKKGQNGLLLFSINNQFPVFYTY